MDNKKQIAFQNHWLNMQHSIEENLTYSHRQPEKAPMRVGKAVPAPQEGYVLPSDELMPTLARINQRMAARQRAGGAEAPPAALVAEDAVDVALRAVDKRRR